MTDVTLTAGEMPVHAAEPAATGARRSWWHRMMATIAEARHRAAVERVVRKNIQDLRDLDDWLLADIGIPRGAIADAARGGHPRDRA